MTERPKHQDGDGTREFESTAKAQLRKALHTALAQYRETMGEGFPIQPRLEFAENDEFGALAEMDGEDFVIRTSTGTVEATVELWRKTFADTDFQNTALEPLASTAEDLTHLGLVWLMLHEMHHYQMEHFQFLGRAHLSESFGANAFAVARQAGPPNPIIAELDEDEVPKVEPSLEMQADHDALEMLLDAYSPHEWPSLRARTASVSAMMMLIERADAKHEQKHSSHPKAATRIFQLLRYLTQMPRIEALLAKEYPHEIPNPYIPSLAERNAFRTQVVMPAFLDAVMLARLTGSEFIATDLGQAKQFMQDIHVTLHEDMDAQGSLTTSGAHQWADLIELNTKLLKMMELG